MHEEEAGGFIIDAGDEPLILSVDTATETRSVAVVRGARTLALHTGEGRNTHSANLLAEVDACLRAAGVRVRDVELFAVAAGPGSFTGLRAGLATVKGFAATLNRPVVGVPTLHAIAHAAGPSARVTVVLPAGRGEVFAQSLRVTPDRRIVELDQPSHVPPHLLLERIIATREPVKWAGSGAHALAELLRARALEESIGWAVEAESAEGSATGAPLWTLAKPVSAIAEHVAALAFGSFQAGQSARAEDLRAIYVRLSDAELKEQCRAPNS